MIPSGLETEGNIIQQILQLCVKYHGEVCWQKHASAPAEVKSGQQSVYEMQ